VSTAAISDRFHASVLHSGAVASSILSADALKREVGKAHEIGNLLECRLIRHGLNDTYLLSTPDERYIARVSGTQRRATQIAYELDLLTHLASKGMRVAVPIARMDGSFILPLSAPEGTRHLVVFTYAPGNPVSWHDLEQCYLAGRLLASIHTASDDFPGPHPGAKADLAAWIDAPLAAIQPYFVHRLADWTFLEALTNKIRARALATVSMGLDFGVCHGDFDAVNIHMVDDHNLTVFDFEFARPGWRAFDFIPVQKAAVSRSSAVWDAFVKGYTDMRPLAAGDLAAVPILPVIGHFCALAHLASHADVWGIRHLSDDKIDDWLNVFRNLNTEQARANA
jgi:Ser/Thr protein kinase RdoA (MazF antagonist)